MYALSSIVKAKFNLLFLKEKQSPPLKVRQKQYTSAFVEEMTERKKIVFLWYSKINRFSLGYRCNTSQEKEATQKSPGYPTGYKK